MSSLQNGWNLPIKRIWKSAMRRYQVPHESHAGVNVVFQVEGRCCGKRTSVQVSEASWGEGRVYEKWGNVIIVPLVTEQRPHILRKGSKMFPHQKLRQLISWWKSYRNTHKERTIAGRQPRIKIGGPLFESLSEAPTPPLHNAVFMSCILFWLSDERNLAHSPSGQLA